MGMIDRICVLCYNSCMGNIMRTFVINRSELVRSVLDVSQNSITLTGSDVFKRGDYE